MRDLGFVGHEGLAWIWERLDHAMYTPGWLDVFFEHQGLARIWERLDHLNFGGELVTT